MSYKYNTNDNLFETERPTIRILSSQKHREKIELNKT
jgi:hypothetical protein